MNDTTSSADDLLRLANSEPAAKRRASLKRTAAQRAVDKEDDPERGLKILDEMTAEERAAGPNLYHVRRQMAIDAVRKTDSCLRAMSIIHHSPDGSQLSIEVASLTRTQAGPPAASCGNEIARDAFAIVSRYRATDPLDYVRYFEALPSPMALRTAMAELDRWQPRIKSQVSKEEDWYPRPDAELVPLPFTTQLLRVDVEGLLATGRNVRTDTLRTAFQLRVLQLFLQRYEQLVKLPKPQSTAAQ